MCVHVPHGEVVVLRRGGEGVEVVPKVKRRGVLMNEDASVEGTVVQPCRQHFLAEVHCVGVVEPTADQDVVGDLPDQNVGVPAGF